MKIIYTLLIAFISIIVKGTPEEDLYKQFKQWEQINHIEFNDVQQIYRFNIFKQNKQKIEDLNQKSDDAIYGVNKFTHYTQVQFASTHFNRKLAYQSRKKSVKPPQATIVNVKPYQISKPINWVTKGGISPIKDQGQCGSCWAFTVVAILQSQILMKKSTLVHLSQQQLVDCAGQEYGNYGCDGGWPSNAFSFVYRNGITTSAQYPYVGLTQACKKPGGQFHINQIYQTTGCQGIINGLQFSPIAVVVDSTKWGSYISGIIKQSQCGKQINHAVTVVGVTQTYFLIKNSWGTDWGQKGYIRLQVGNTCGVCNNKGSFPILI